MANAVRACRVTVDPCSAVGGGALVPVQQVCLYSYDATGAKGEPYFECRTFDSNEYFRVYFVTCGATAVEVIRSLICDGITRCPPANSLAFFTVSHLSALEYATEAACESAVIEDDIIQQLLDLCSQNDRTGSAGTTVDGCDQGSGNPKCL
jgi:hypothetical protein